MIELAIAMMFATANETTFAEDVRVCHETGRDYYDSRSCIESIWKDRDATMPHCANDDAGSINCIWEGTESGARYIDVDGIAYYVRLDHMTLAV